MTEPQITGRQRGQWMRGNWTQVRDTVKACGHKFSRTDIPRTNCEDCWEAYFVTAEVSKTMDIDHRVLEAQYGKKYLTMLRRYLERNLHNGLLQAEEGREEGTDSSNGSDIQDGAV
jgi:hypothetical protein